MTRMTGFIVWAYGQQSWHRSLDRAIAVALSTRNWCSNPQVIDVASGDLMFGRPE